MQIFCILYYIFSFIQTVPCLYKLIKTKSSKDYSLMNRLLQYLALICFTVYILTNPTSDLITIINGFIDLGLLTLENIFILIYRKGNKKDE